MPQAPSANRKIGRISLAMLEVVFFINTNFDERQAIKTLSDIIFSEEKTINNINSKEKIILSLTNNNFGENVFKKTRKNIEMNIEVNPTSVNEVFIFLFFYNKQGNT